MYKNIWNLYVRCFPVQDVVATEKVTPDAKHSKAADVGEEMTDDSRPRNLLASLDDAAGKSIFIPCCHGKMWSYNPFPQSLVF